MTLESIGFKFFAKIMKGSCVFDVQVVLVLTLILLGIFKIALCLRGRHVFM